MRQGARNYGKQNDAHGIPMDSGAWYRWLDIMKVASQALPSAKLPESKPFDLHTACSLEVLGDMDKERLQFSVLLQRDHTRRSKSKYERFA